MGSTLRIGIAYSLKPVDAGDDGPDDRYEEFDKPETVQAIADVIRGEGHDVVPLGDGPELLVRVMDDPPDFVFNIAEGQGVGRSREARVPAALEMLGIPYSGSDPLTLAVALDKDVARRLVGAWGVRVPAATRIGLDPNGSALGPQFHRGSPNFPVIVKPAFEGSSKGIRGHCLAETPEEAAAIGRRLGRDYRQPLVVEQFIDGDEVTVGVIGNIPHAQNLGILRVVPRGPAERFVYSLEVKRDWANRVDYEAPAAYDLEVRNRLTLAAQSVYHALGCRDVARIDFRVKEGIPYFIEANPLPGLTPGVSDLVILAEGYGIRYDELIRRILTTALARVGLVRPEAVAS